MHFILLVYKYEYIMNKSSYFVDLLILCGIFVYGISFYLNNPKKYRSIKLTFLLLLKESFVAAQP